MHRLRCANPQPGPLFVTAVLSCHVFAAADSALVACFRMLQDNTEVLRVALELEEPTEEPA